MRACSGFALVLLLLSWACPIGSLADTSLPEPLKREILRIQNFLELDLGLPVFRQNCRFKACGADSLFAGQVFSKEIEFHFTEDFPKGCPSGTRACTQGNRSYFRPALFERMSRQDQAYLILFERLEAFSPYEPRETRMEFIRALRSLERKFRNAEPVEADEARRIERLPVLIAQLCQNNLVRPLQVLPTGALLFGKNRIEGEGIELGPGAVLFNTSVRGKNIRIRASKVTGFVEGEGIAIENSEIYDSVHGSRISIQRSVVAPENRFSVFSNYDWRRRQVRIQGNDIELSGAWLDSTMVSGNGVRILNSRVGPAPDADSSNKRSSFSKDSSYPFIVWLSAFDDELARMLFNDPMLKQVQEDLDFVLAGQIYFGDRLSLERSEIYNVFRIYPYPDQEGYLERGIQDFVSSREDRISVRGDGIEVKETLLTHSLPEKGQLR